jgi:putative FmdB family regulatory protein
MPLYEYECKDCSAKFEKMVSLSASAKTVECPECGSTNTGKLISGCRFSSGSSSMGSSSMGSCSGHSHSSGFS